MAETTEAKGKPGRRRNKPRVPVDTLPISALTKGRHHLSKATGISEDDAGVIRKVTGLTVEEFQEKQRAELQRTMEAALAQTDAMMHKASALQAATIYGILDDKHGRQKQGNQTLHIHLAAGDRSGAINALLGKHGERVFSSGSIPTKAVKIEPPGPVVEGEAVDLPAQSLATDSQSHSK